MKMTLLTDPLDPEIQVDLEVLVILCHPVDLVVQLNQVAQFDLNMREREREREASMMVLI